MSGLIDRIITSWQASQENLAQRVADKTQPELLYATPTFLLYANLLYVVVTVVLYKIMQHQEKGFKLKPMIAVYNTICVFAAGYCLVGIVRFKLQDPGSFVGLKGAVNTSECHYMAHLFWAFYIQKFWEFMDTWFFILRKSLRQVTFLHLFHHSSINIVVGMILPFDYCGDLWLPIMLNSLVHVLMYSHYLVTALGIRSWWRKYLTFLQLAQFVLISMQSLLSFSNGPGFGAPDWAKVLLIIYMGSMLLLFGNFFYRRYIIKTPNAIPPACAGVIKENENGEEVKMFSGVATIGKDGKCTVEMNEYFAFIYSAHKQSDVALVYQLTAIGASMPNLHVDKEVGAFDNRSFSVAGGEGGARVSWTVTMIIQKVRKWKSQ